jgi:hypothetical protein
MKALIGKWERWFWALLGTGIIVFCATMSIHGSWAKSIVPRGPGGPPVIYDGDQWIIKVIIYDATRGMALTFGNQQTGAVLFKTKEACETALGNELKHQFDGIAEQAKAQLGPQTRIAVYCLPAQIGEEVN